MLSRFTRRLLAIHFAAALCLLSAPAGAEPINYTMVTVGNPGNANDTGGTFNGAVNYSYQIGTYSVTIGSVHGVSECRRPNWHKPQRHLQRVNGD
jgi:hypothetical protein